MKQGGAREVRVGEKEGGGYKKHSVKQLKQKLTDRIIWLGHKRTLHQTLNHHKERLKMVLV